MPFTIPNVSSATYAAQAGLDSGDIAVMAAAPGGTGVQSGCAVTAQATPNMTVAVAAGVARVGGRRVVVAGGNVTIAAADATNPRHDLITADTAGALAAVTGTPAAITASSEPTYPAIPANRVVLAAVYVPATDTAVDASQITDKRVIVTAPGVENILWYGAVGDGVTDDTAAVTAAVAAVTAASLTGTAGVVFVPRGNYITDKLPPLPNRAGLVGTGPGVSRLWRLNGGTTTGPFVSITTNARMVTISGITVDGRGVGDATSHGIMLDNSAAAGTDATNGISEWVDGRHYVSDVLVQNAKGNGLHITGRGVTMVDRVQAWLCDGHGFYGGLDSHYSQCDAGSSGLDGFFIANGNTRYVGCKAWFSGRISTTGAGVTGGTGHGFHIADNNYSSVTLAACEAQDNARAGFFLSNVGRHILGECMADSNNTAGLNHAGFEVLGAYDNWVTGFAWDRAANTNHQLAGIRVTGGGENLIDVRADYTTMAQGSITTDSAIVNGDRVAVGSAALAVNVGTYTGSTMNFPMTLGDVFTGTLTAATTFGFIQNLPGPQVKTFIIKQDATGSRTLTWPKPASPTVAAPAVYWAGGTTPVVTTTANATDVFQLITADGVRWYGTRLVANAS